MPGVVAGALAVFFAVGNVASAHGAMSDDGIRPCYDRSSGVVRVVDSVHDRCRASEKSLSWFRAGDGEPGDEVPTGGAGRAGDAGRVGDQGATGDAGVVGPAGDAGATGAPGAGNTVFAKIRADGGVAYERGVVSVGGTVPRTPRETGAYRIIFDRDVSTCVPAVTRSDLDLPQPADIRVLQVPDAPTDMIVRFTVGTSSTPADLAFYIAVIC